MGVNIYIEVFWLAIWQNNLGDIELCGVKVTVTKVHSNPKVQLA